MHCYVQRALYPPSLVYHNYISPFVRPLMYIFSDSKLSMSHPWPHFPPLSQKHIYYLSHTYCSPLLYIPHGLLNLSFTQVYSSPSIFLTQTSSLHFLLPLFPQSHTLSSLSLSHTVFPSLTHIHSLLSLTPFFLTHFLSHSSPSQSPAVTAACAEKPA